MEDTPASSQAEMMYKIRQKVMAKSQGFKKAAGIKIRKGQMKMSKYHELKTLDTFHSVIPTVKPKEEKKTPQKRQIMERDPRPSRQASTLASERLSALDSEVFSDDDTGENFHPRYPKSCKKIPQKRQIMKRDPRPSRQASTLASERLSALDSEVFSDDDTGENFHPRCPKPVRLKKRMFREMQDDWSSEDDDWNLGNTDTKSKKRALPPPPVLSEYEKSVQQKVAERQKFLEELGISQAKKELEDLHKSTSPKSQKHHAKMPKCHAQRVCKNRNSLPSNSVKQDEYPVKDTVLPDPNEVDSLKDSPLNVTNTENSTHSIPQNSALRNTEMITSCVDVGSGKTTQVLNEQVVTDKKLPQMLRRLKSSAVRAGKHAKSAKIVSKSLKKNLNKLTNSDSHPRHVLNTLGDAKRKLKRIIS